MYKLIFSNKCNNAIIQINVIIHILFNFLFKFYLNLYFQIEYKIDEMITLNKTLFKKQKSEFNCNINNLNVNIYKL